MNMMMGLLNKMNPETIANHQARAQDIMNNPENY